jgi:hypothetical protein
VRFPSSSTQSENTRKEDLGTGWKFAGFSIGNPPTSSRDPTDSGVFEDFVLEVEGVQGSCITLN